ncbi:MAG TPA: maleylpyruvate isomerase family mycothiol-dependent enzyme [Mycobacteriales bacterium]
MLGTERLLAEVPAWADRFATLITDADPGAAVPTTPEWDLTALTAHVGGAFRWMTAIVATRATAPVRARDVPGRRMPPDPAQRPDWIREGAAELTGAVRTVGPSTTVWSWAGGSAPATFWLRRQLYELVVHTADAAPAVGRTLEIEADLGADGIDEWLEILPHAPGADPEALRAGRSMHLHATDGELGPAGEWLLRGAADGFEWSHGHAKGDVAVRGAAGALYLVLHRRLPADDPRVEVLGDRQVLDSWLAATSF